MKTRWQKIKEATSQLIAVVLFGDADEDEMLSTYAWRTQNKKLIAILDGMFGKGHCQQSYEWENHVAQ